MQDSHTRQGSGSRQVFAVTPCQLARAGGEKTHLSGHLHEPFGCTNLMPEKIQRKETLQSEKMKRNPLKGGTLVLALTPPCLCQSVVLPRVRNHCRGEEVPSVFGKNKSLQPPAQGDSTGGASRMSPWPGWDGLRA